MEQWRQFFVSTIESCIFELFKYKGVNLYGNYIFMATATCTDPRFVIKKRLWSRTLIEADDSVLDLLEHYDWENNRYIHPVKIQILLDASKPENLSKYYDSVDDLFSDLDTD